MPQQFDSVAYWNDFLSKGFPFHIEDPLDGTFGSSPSRRIFHQHEREDDESHRLYQAEKSRFKVFLGWTLSRDEMFPFLTENVEDFVLFQHQAGGHRCEKIWFFVRPIVVSNSFLRFARSLTDEYSRYKNGWFDARNVNEQDRLQYRTQLSQWGLSARLDATQPFIESVYPINATQEILDEICPEKCALSDIIELLGIGADRIASLAIWIISDNSD